jgi:hypothetical protein
MLRVVGVFIVLAFISCKSSNSDEVTTPIEPKAELVALVPFDSLNFTIQQPEGWGYKMKVKGAELILIDNTCDSCLVKSVIMVIDFLNKDTLTLQQAVDQNIKSTQEYYQEFNLISQTEVDLNGLNAQRLNYTAINSTKDSIGAVTYYVLKEDKVYFINCMGPNTNNLFSSNIDFFDGVCQTFKFNKVN